MGAFSIAENFETYIIPLTLVAVHAFITADCVNFIGDVVQGLFGFMVHEVHFFRRVIPSHGERCTKGDYHFTERQGNDGLVPCFFQSDQFGTGASHGYEESIGLLGGQQETFFQFARRSLGAIDGCSGKAALGAVVQVADHGFECGDPATRPAGAGR
jgi:hypothetical protein